MASSPQHEPTMEEILASIRKIISEDSSEAHPAPMSGSKAAAATRGRASAPTPVPPPVEADVLELTQELEEPAHEPEPEPEPLQLDTPISEPEDDVVFETPEEPAVTNEAPARSHEGIFSDRTRKAMDKVFAQLDPQQEPAQRSYAAPIPAVDGQTVEAAFERAVREAFDPVVRNWLGTNADAIVERMKPLIREWMDEHFPALLEGAVREEVARVAKARATPVPKR